MTSDNTQLAVLVHSCDKYSDLWKPFFQVFSRFWPDCPYQVYLTAENEVFSGTEVTTLRAGQPMQWSNLLLWALEQIPQPYILLLLDDYLLLKSVDNNRLNRIFGLVRSLDAAYVRLFPVPGPDEPIAETAELGIIRKGSPYRNSTQAAIWDKEVLRSLLIASESAWEFEYNGSKRSEKIEKPFLSVFIDEKGDPLEEGNYPLTYFCTAVNRGKWRREAVTLCKKMGVTINLNVRAQETVGQQYRRKLDRLLVRALKQLKQL